MLTITRLRACSNKLHNVQARDRFLVSFANVLSREWTPRYSWNIARRNEAILISIFSNGINFEKVSRILQKYRILWIVTWFSFKWHPLSTSGHSFLVKIRQENQQRPSTLETNTVELHWNKTRTNPKRLRIRRGGLRLAHKKWFSNCAQCGPFVVVAVNRKAHPFPGQLINGYLHSLNRESRIDRRMCI